MKSFITFLFIVSPIYFGYATTGGPTTGGEIRVNHENRQSMMVERVTLTPATPIDYVLDDAITQNTVIVNLETKMESDNAFAKDLAETVEGSGIECKSVDLTCPAPSNGQPGNFAFFESFLNWEPEPEYSLGVPFPAQNEMPMSSLNQWVITNNETAPPTKAQLCTCLKNNVSSPDLENQKRAEEKKIKDKIRQSMSEKVLNNYTNHFEDVRFYATNARAVFNDDPMKQTSGISKVQCADPEKFIDAMKDNNKCKAQRLSPEDRDKKLNAILKSFDPKMDADFYGNLRKIQQQIYRNSTEKSTSESWGARRRFDEQRLVLIKGSSFVSTSDKIVSKLLSSEAFKTSLMAKQLVSPKTPQDAIIEILAEEFKAGKIKDLLDKDSLGDVMFAQLESDIASGKSGSFLNMIASNLTRASELHPGFDRLMRDPKLFADVTEKVKSPITAVNVIDSDTLMKDHFNESCKKVTTDFADIACASDDELLGRVSERELNKCMKEVGASKPDSARIQSLIQCDAILAERTEVVGGSLFEIPGDRSSQYRNLVTKSSEPSIARLLSSEVSASNPIIANALKKAEELFGPAPSAYDGHDNVAKEIFGKEYTPRPNAAYVEAKKDATKIQQSEKTSDTNFAGQVQQDARQDSRQDAVVDQANYSTNSAAIPSSNGSNSSPSSSNSKVDTAKEMRDFLADENAKDAAAKLVNDSSDDVMKELIRLKDETEKNKLRILELSSDNEKLKLQATEAQLIKLQKERAALEPGEPVVTEPSELTKKDKNFQPSTVRENSRDIASSSQNDAGTTTSGSAQSAQVSASGQGSLANLNRALLASSGLRGDDGPERVVVSSATTRSASLEIKSQDVGLDLLNYISSSDADIQTLINLKTSGIMYKYKVVENGEVVEKEMLIDYQNLNDDVKQLIDKKISQSKGRASEVARLDKEIKDLRRIYSYSALKIILGEQMKK